MQPFETIVAPATAPGEGSIGIVRLSGVHAVALLEEVFSGKTPVQNMSSHRLYRGRLLNREQRIVDSVLVVIMRAPHSYTGEDVVEVHCHGGSQVLRGVLDLFLECGAVMAAPGEFTKRAFLNGRLDLAQAEAVIDVIRARSERSGRVALSQLEGRLSRQIHAFADELKQSLALLEAHIDFPDDEVGSLDLPALIRPINRLHGDICELTETFDTGRILREGLSLLILGRPNVGKSSLMNALLGEARAIVTPIPGTTRDTLEENLVLAGVPLRLIDSAGVRDTEDVVEREGVRRAREKASAADLVLLVVDGSESFTEEDRLAMSLCQPETTLAVVNKSDLPRRFSVQELGCIADHVEISTLSGDGLDGLKEAIVDKVRGGHGPDEEGLVVSERRHRDALLRASRALERLVAAANSRDPLECLAMELRDALAALGEITGETTPDEILDQIFSRFCIGK